MPFSMTSSAAHVISARGASTSVASMIEGLSRPEESYAEPPSQISQSGAIQENFQSATLAPKVIANTIAVTTRILVLTQITNIAGSSCARESFIATLVDGTSVETSAPETRFCFHVSVLSSYHDHKNKATHY